MIKINLDSVKKSIIIYFLVTRIYVTGYFSSGPIPTDNSHRPDITNIK